MRANQYSCSNVVEFRITFLDSIPIKQLSCQTLTWLSSTNSIGSARPSEYLIPPRAYARGHHR